MLVGSDCCGSGSYGMLKKSEMARSAESPARTHNAAYGDPGMSIVEFANDAASSTTPAAVPHDRSLRGERKKTNDACDVCVSSTSANQSCHCVHTSSSLPSSSMRLTRTRKSIDDGGVPARADSFATSTSRRENTL